MACQQLTRHLTQRLCITPSWSGSVDRRENFGRCVDCLRTVGIQRSLSYERSFEVSGVPLVIHLYKVRKLSSASRFLEEKLRSARERAKQSED